MLSHLSFGVADLEVARKFYGAALGPLGMVEVWETADGAGFGAPGGDDVFAIKQRDSASPPGPGFHLAFDAGTREAVNRWHELGIGAGGTDEGAPGLRPHYHPNYYGAYVRDPDGNKLQAVCHSAKG